MAEAKPQPQRAGFADPVQVDPKHYTVELENEKIRVLRIRYGAGERSIMHGHPDGLAVFLTAAHGKFTLPDGSTQEAQGIAGEILWMPAGEHLPENVGDQPFEVLLVELKQ